MMAQAFSLKKISIAVSSLCLAFTLVACGEDKSTTTNNNSDVLVNQKFSTVTKINGKTFGTFYYITVPGSYPGGESTLRNDAEFVFKKVSDAISTFDPNSEISKFNEFQSTDPFPISNYLAEIIEEAVHEGRRIKGAMDITVGPLVNMWGFGPAGEVKSSPSDEQILEVKKYVGLDKVSVRRTGNKTAYLQKQDPRVKIDLSTIGEGLAADEIAAIMDEKGVANYMIAIAGAIRSKGANPEGKLWRVGVEDPLSHGQAVFERVCPQGMAISTAGSYRNFFLDEKSGEFFSHIIDPKTGRPINHRTVSVTVIDREAIVTDALDTGLLVLGAAEAVKWGNENDVAVYAIEINESGKPSSSYSKAFAPFLKCSTQPVAAINSQLSASQANQEGDKQQ